MADVIKRAMPVWGTRMFGAAILKVLKLEHMRPRRLEEWQQSMVDESTPDDG